MSIPVVEIEHKQRAILCKYCPRWIESYPEGCRLPTCPKVCAPDCPACAVEANNKAWAKYLVEQKNLMFDEGETDQRMVFIPISDWEQIKKLAEEKVDG